MIISDSHLHTGFSHDSTENPQKYLDAALAIGAKFLAITDHIDNGSYHMGDSPPIDLDRYFAELGELRDRYKERVLMSIGIEMGFTPQNSAENATMIAENDFDCVINSVHEVGGVDCYFAEYFAGKDQFTAYMDYLVQVRESLEVPYYYSSVGHIGYVTRKSPYNIKLKYTDYDKILDDILTTIIKKGKVLELNSSVADSKEEIVPSVEIAQRYYDLGGRLIHFGSDAHSVSRFAENFVRTRNIAKKIGFKHFTVCHKKEYIHYDL